MNQTTTIHSQTVIADMELYGVSSVSTKYDNTARKARYDACIRMFRTKVTTFCGSNVYDFVIR